MQKFSDNFTLDGRVAVPRGVTPDSVGKVAKLVEQASRGSRIAEAQIVEGMMSGAIASSVAHFINVITIPQLPLDKDRPVAKLAGFRTVPDFRPAVLHSLYGQLEGPGLEADGSAPRVGQGQPFPILSVTGVESAYAKIAKRGNRINWDFEDFINDAIGILDGMPSELRDIALQTEWSEIGDALVAASTALPAVTLPDGTVVPTNAPASANAIFAAIQALAVREVNGAKIGTLAGYNLVVPVGRKVFVDYDIRKALSIVQIVPGSGGGAVYGPTDNSALNIVEVIEHEKVTGTEWYLLPKPGAYRRPVLDLLRLRGYETPQIRVKTEGGDGFSFDADTAAMRLRLVTGGALWDQTPVVFSDGTGS